MQLTPSAIDTLTAKLTGPDDASLTTDERRLVLDTIGALLAAQSVIARQSRLLKSYQHDVDSLDATGHASLTRFAQALQSPSPADRYDFAKARAAGATLLEEVARAESLAGFISSVLKFARHVAVLAA